MTDPELWMILGAVLVAVVVLRFVLRLAIRLVLVALLIGGVVWLWRPELLDGLGF